MNNLSANLLELKNSLYGEVKGEIRTDEVTRILFSTDASIYQIEPVGVFTPHHIDDLAVCIEAACSLGIPILPRGSGSSLAGQAIGSALILDCSQKLDHIIDINPEERIAIVEPGVILATLNRRAATYGLQFGPDPASDKQATLGGVIGNNATGAHSIRYGMSADQVLTTEVILADGSIAEFGEISLAEARNKAGLQTREGEIYRAAISIRESKDEIIRRDWPKTWRRASGYNLNYLIPWTPSLPPQWSLFNRYVTEASQLTESLPYPPIKKDTLNLATLVAGSEGTLGVIRQATVRLVPLPAYSILVVLAFPNIASACYEVINILDFQPSAVELIPASMISSARLVPAYAHQVSFLSELQQGNGNEPNLLVVEFAGTDIPKIRHKVSDLVGKISTPYLLAEETDLQNKIWNVRKVGLGLLMSKPGDTKPIHFIEDLSVPVENLHEFVLEMKRILADHKTTGDFYAHASSGCLHIRPLVNLKTVQGIHSLREIASEAIDLIIRMGGSPSGEHGDGIARSEWLERVFGSQLLQAFRELKYAADPAGLLNPGKIIDPPSMDGNLRFGSSYFTKSWKPIFDFSNQSSMVEAVELCNGAGVCRKTDGIMCPSFQVTKDELHSTRGRANLLRAMYSNRLSLEEKDTLEIIFEALDLCLACKGCKAECPSTVDMAKLKYEFLEYYYHQDGVGKRKLRDYFFAHVGDLTRYGSYLPALTNVLLSYLDNSRFGKQWLGITYQRKLPRINSRSLKNQLKNAFDKQQINGNLKDRVLFLLDPFTAYYQPQVGIKALEILAAIGCEVEIIPITGSGRPLLSKGFLKSARAHAEKLIESIVTMGKGIDLPIIGVEPSEVYTLRDEYVDLFPSSDDIKRIAERVFMLDEYLVRPRGNGEARLMRIVINTNKNHTNHSKILLHGHCHQKAQPPAKDGYPSGLDATVEMLEKVGYQVEVLDTGCCGMAGAFGYEAEHYDLSIKIGELSLFPQIRKSDQADIIATSGYSCITQIKEGTCKIPVHPITLVSEQIS